MTDTERPGGLPERMLRLAIADAIIDRRPLLDIVDTLFREDPDRVRLIHREIILQRADLAGVPPQATCYRRRRRSQPRAMKEHGITVSKMAEKFRLRRETLARLLEHHCYLELAPYDGRQQRRLVTEAAVEAGYGWNVLPANRIGHLEGENKACIFPVFHQDWVDAIWWSLDFETIRNAASSISKKRQRRSYLLDEHKYLPDAEIAELAGYSVRGIEKARSCLAA